MKERNASKRAECRHPVGQRHAAFLAINEAKATKQHSSAILISSSGCGLFCSFGASSLSKTPAAAAVDHAAAALTPTERQGGVCGCVFRGHSNCHRPRRPSCSRVIISARNVSQRPSLPQTFLQSTVQILICVWVSVGEAEKRSKGRHIRTARGTAGWQRYMRYGPTSTITHGVSTHTHRRKRKQKTRRQGVAVCVARRVSASPDRKEKQNKRERNVCSAPQALVARPHVTAPSARRSSRPSSCVQQARRTGPSS
ncbi:hypothetical protein TCDM_10505 [Trypanosoma cruzi Dm28c]|uniref:Uncharacterized protein n=1 Tax=Trypanosoma cruzi Dm28c TaxID=1416333 RepID=V5AMD8_TRYCR|nr:hypothetical protein TCDM_10505 [Trypanosoma cruzi Dm28c]